MRTLSQFVSSQSIVHILYLDSAQNNKLENVLNGLCGVVIERFASLTALEVKMRAIDGNSITILARCEEQKDALLRHVREVERLNNTRMDALVRSLILVGESASPALIHEIRAFGAEALPLSPEDVAIKPFVDFFLWELMQGQKSLPTMRILFSNSDEATVLLVGRIAEVELIYRGKLLDLFETMADNRWRTKKYLAHHIDIALSSVNEYVKRLRDEFNLKKRRAGVSTTGKQVFQSRKVSGVWVYRLKANVIK